MSAQDTPTQTAQAAFDALAERDWRRLAGVVDSDALEKLRQDALGMLILTSEQRLAGQKAQGGYNPNEVVITDHLPRIGSQRVQGFRGRPTITRLASLTPPEFFIEWAEAAYPKRPDDPIFEVAGLYRRIIGEIAETTDAAYVVYRREHRSIEDGEPQLEMTGRVMVMPLVRSGGGWRIKLNDDIGWSLSFSHVVFPERQHPVSKVALPPRVAPPEPPAPRPERVAASPSPLEVVRSAFAAFEGRNCVELAALVHPDVLQSFQQGQLSYYAVWSQSRQAADSAKSQGVAFIMFSYDSLSKEALAQVADVEMSIFPAHPTIGALSRLSPREFFQEWCRAAYGTSGETLGNAKATMHRKLIGQLFEGENSAHVLYQSEGFYSAIHMALRWTDGGWRMMLNDDIGWFADLDLEQYHEDR